MDKIIDLLYHSDSVNRLIGDCLVLTLEMYIHVDYLNMITSNYDEVNMPNNHETYGGDGYGDGTLCFYGNDVYLGDGEGHGRALYYNSRSINQGKGSYNISNRTYIRH
jgi:hypothetical protein